MAKIILYRENGARLEEICMNKDIFTIGRKSGNLRTKLIKLK
jgi:hypothetical protein